MTSPNPPFEPPPAYRIGPSNSGSYYAETRWRHPTVSIILTIFTLLPLGFVLFLIVKGFLWAPWDVHAFQATNDEELWGHYGDILFSIILGLPLCVIGLTCGHFAAWLAWPEPPSPTPRNTLAKRDKKPVTTRIAKTARAAGRVRATLIVVLLTFIAFGYLSILLQGFYLVWRLITPETI